MTVETYSTEAKKRYEFLLQQTGLFQHFINNGKGTDFLKWPKTKNTLKKSSEQSLKDHRHKRTEKEEDQELLEGEEQKNEHFTKHVFTESPFYVQGQMRDYQIQGLNWLISLHSNCTNGILADEMGLGKTLQTISFLGYLYKFENVHGPHLVIVPKSTMENWAREFQKWCPFFKVLLFRGTKDERQDIVHDELLSLKFDICITSYELILRERAHFKKISWQYLVVDEAHRIKNEQSMLAQVVRILSSKNRLLITGTPLQNNLHELWALLNFLLPDVFSNSEDFDEWFQGHGEEDSDMVVKKLHQVLRPFLLRRVKSDVEKSLKPKKEINLYVGMSEMQIRWYQKILEKDIDAVNGTVGKREGQTRLLNIVMQLRKCCNHPYLFDGAEPGPPYTTDEHIVQNSGKMILLDKLLKKMKEQGSRVLIFSQMSRVLDILEDYCYLRNYEYCRIDGQTDHADRIEAIDEYNRPDSTKFIFLLTTRAGGLGINLTSADIVVLYDSDWNPQADLQAMDRAHRIGQTKQVFVFRLVTENAIEEKVLERAAQKLRLDQLVIQQGRNLNIQKKETNKDDLLNMIQHGATNIFETSKSTINTENDISEIIKQGEERTQKLHQRFANLGIDELQKVESDSSYEWDGKSYSKKKENNDLIWINPAKRERGNQTYSIDQAYRGIFSRMTTRSDRPTRAPRPPKQIHIQDHQFFPPRLSELQDKETAYFRKMQGYRVPVNVDESKSKKEREEIQKKEQAEIDNSVPLTDAEKEEKDQLCTEGFGDWSRRAFLDFVHACARHGRDNYEAIAQDVDGKTVEDIKKYSEAFWKQYKEIEGYDRYIVTIESGEQKLKRVSLQSQLLREKIGAYKSPLIELKFNYYQNKGKTFNEDEDRFIAVKLCQYGLERDDVYERIRDELRESPYFRLDWFIKSRTPIEIQRRCQTLLTCITKELTEANKKRPSNAKPATTNLSNKSHPNSKSIAPPPASSRSRTNSHPATATPSSRSANSRSNKSSPTPRSARGEKRATETAITTADLVQQLRRSLITRSSHSPSTSLRNTDPETETESEDSSSTAETTTQSKYSLRTKRPSASGGGSHNTPTRTTPIRSASKRLRSHR